MYQQEEVSSIMTSGAQGLQGGRRQSCKFEHQVGLVCLFFLFFMAAYDLIDKHTIPKFRPTSNPRLSPYPLI